MTRLQRLALALKLTFAVVAIVSVIILGCAFVLFGLDWIAAQVDPRFELHWSVKVGVAFVIMSTGLFYMLSGIDEE